MSQTMLYEVYFGLTFQCFADSCKTWQNELFVGQPTTGTFVFIMM